MMASAGRVNETVIAILTILCCFCAVFAPNPKCVFIDEKFYLKICDGNVNYKDTACSFAVETWNKNDNLTNGCVLEPIDYNGFGKTKNVWFFDQEMSEVKSEWFPKDNRITAIFSEKGKIKTLQPGAFANLNSLTSFEINGNLLTRIDSNMFANKTLETVSLIKNNISYIQFDNATIQKLHLYKNGIKFVNTSCFNNIKGLYTLTLNNNQISSIRYGSFRNLSSLQTLFLHNNTLHRLPRDFDNGMTSLKKLYIYHNQLRKIQSNTFTQPDSPLEEILFHHNKIHTVEAMSFKHMKKLLRIDLSHNEIQELPATTFNGSTDIERIDLNDNKLKTLHNDILTPLWKLNILDLARNRIAFLTENVFRLSWNLKKLDLSFNNLTVLPDRVFGYGTYSMHELFLNNNQIQIFEPNTFNSLLKVKYLNIAHNNMTYMYADLLSKFTKEEHPENVDLRGNPWQCPCLDQILKRFEAVGTKYFYYSGGSERPVGKPMLICVWIPEADDFCVKEPSFTINFQNIYNWALQRYGHYV